MPFNRSLYPDNWRELSAWVRFERAGNRCECSGECGRHGDGCAAINYNEHPVTGSKVVLTVAHLDHDISNNNLSNLKAMCQWCHLNYDAAYHARNAAETRRQRLIENGQMELWTDKLE